MDWVKIFRQLYGLDWVSKNGPMSNSGPELYANLAGELPEALAMDREGDEGKERKGRLGKLTPL